MKVLALIASGAAVLSSVDGHGYIVDPEAQWEAGYAENGYGSTVDNEIWGVYDNSVYGYGVAATVAFFEDQWPSSGYDSLGQFIIANQELASDTADEQCGLTVYDDSARSTMPSGNLTYSGFTHQGPCEAWCDDNKLFFEYDCSVSFPSGSMAYDSSLCTDANRFTIYWLALHGDPWQAYIDCVWIEGGSGSGSAPSPVTEEADASTSTTTTTTSSASGSTTATTTASTTGSTTGSSTTTTTTTSADASTAGEASTTTTTTAPTTTTATPTTTTATPTTTTATSTSTTTTTSTPSPSEKCTASARRRHRN